MGNYSLRFLFQDERSKSCRVHIKDKKRNWIGAIAYVPNHFPIWFAYNKHTGAIRHGKDLQRLRRLLPVAYGRILMNLRVQFGETNDE